jgi:hypothetical protein
MHPETPKQVFVSYSHQDEKWLKELRTTLAHYERDGQMKLDLWSDKKISPGDDWREEIEKVLMRSSAAILLVTKDFLASEFIYDRELQPLLALAKEKGTRILWIAVSASNVHDTVIASYQALNSNPNKPLDRLPVARRNEELVQITQKILTACGLRKSEHAPRSISDSSPKSEPRASSVAPEPLNKASREMRFSREHNFDAYPDLKKYVNERPIQNATLIQMSCLNERHVIRDLWRTEAKIELFLSSGEEQFGVSEWQRNRIERFLMELQNELRNISGSPDSGEISLYKYHAPASIRAVLLDDKIMTTGPFLYQVHDVDGRGPILDVRGGELPLLLLKAGDPDFDVFRGMIIGLIKNWNSKGVADHFATLQHSDCLPDSPVIDLVELWRRKKDAVPAIRT